MLSSSRVFRSRKNLERLFEGFGESLCLAMRALVLGGEAGGVGGIEEMMGLRGDIGAKGGKVQACSNLTSSLSVLT